MSSGLGSLLLKIGGLGFLLGLVSVVVWAVLAVLSLGGVLLYNGDFRWMSGIFFQAPYSRVIFYGILSLSLLFSAVGCFALSMKQVSWLALFDGVVFVAAMAIAVTYLLSFVGLRSGVYPNPYPPQLSYAIRLLPLSFFAGLILWGVTLLRIARKIDVDALGRSAGAIFVVCGGFGILLWQVVLYLGFEFWLLLMGWLYAIAALMTALIFFRISRMPWR